jgi:superfamily II DNA/RNA helicase
MQHKEQGNVFFSKVNTVVIDEVDTMLTQGFGSDIRAILRNIMTRTEKEADVNQSNLQMIMATATLTKAVKTLLSDVKGGGFNIEYSGKKPLETLLFHEFLHRSLDHRPNQQNTQETYRRRKAY